MAVELQVPENILPVKGIRLAAISAGIYARSRNDLSIIEIPAGSRVSAVFTSNQFCAAPVILAKKHLKNNSPRYLLINAGNANAGTGDEGIKNAHNSCSALAEIGSCKVEEVLPFSTGVIGENLPIEKINNKLPQLFEKLSDDNWLSVAESIMTTDTVPKIISKTFLIDEKKVTITGIAKGAGMIQPNMATMLSFIATDANISKELIDQALIDSVNRSFNRITVDGDMSTNDACVLIATGQANNSEIGSEDVEEFRQFFNALNEVFIALAQAIVRDGEGATKFVEIEVSGGETQKDCLSVAYSIANSPLVKTALTASDPNWGRILASVGNAGVKNMNIEKVSICLGDVCIVENGRRAATYTEQAGKDVFLKDEIKIIVNLGVGKAEEKIWTTDLSYEYIKINAEYRT